MANLHNNNPNLGFMEIASADEGTNSIYIKQYTKNANSPFGTIKNSLTLLDVNGNTAIPNDLFVKGTNVMNKLGLKALKTDLSNYYTKTEIDKSIATDNLRAKHIDVSTYIYNNNISGTFTNEFPDNISNAINLIPTVSAIIMYYNDAFTKIKAALKKLNIPDSELWTLSLS